MSMKLLKLAIFLFTFVQGATASWTNISSLSYKQGNSGGEPRICVGTIDPNAELEEIGVTQSIIKTGTNCEPGDFDGNGYLDFAFWEVGPLPGTARKFKIVFFEKARVIKTQTITDLNVDNLTSFVLLSSDLIDFYQAHKISFGKIPKRLSGLEQRNDLHMRIEYLYNPQTKSLQRFESDIKIDNSITEEGVE